MDDDVTAWLHRLSDGDEGAAQAIWERYFQKLVRLARRQLDGLPRRAADEEDVALSAMKSFFRGMKEGRFQHLDDREDLWKLLVTITAHKALAQLRRERAQRRGRGRVRGDSISTSPDSSQGLGDIDQVMGREPTPALACQMAENCRLLLERLGDETLQTIALCKLEGYTNKEIAGKLDVTVRTVERKLMRIRQRWRREVG